MNNMTFAEFLAYLEQVQYDLEDSGREATAADYAECVRRFEVLIEKLELIQSITMGVEL